MHHSSYCYYAGISRHVHSIVVNDLNAFVGKTVMDETDGGNSMVPFNTAGTFVEMSGFERAAEYCQSLFTCSKCIIISVTFDGRRCTLSSDQAYTTVAIHVWHCGFVLHHKQEC